MKTSYLVQILLPTADNDGKSFPDVKIENIKDTLIRAFGGVTAFTQSPAEGVWEPAGEAKTRDNIVIIEVMAPEIDETWWTNFRQALEADLEQDEIVIRAQTITKL